MFVVFVFVAIILYFFFPKYFPAFLKVCGILFGLILLIALCMQFGSLILYLAGCFLLLIALVAGTKMVLWKFYGTSDIVLWEDNIPRDGSTPFFLPKKSHEKKD